MDSEHTVKIFRTEEDLRWCASLAHSEIDYKRNRDSNLGLDLIEFELNTIQ